MKNILIVLLCSTSLFAQKPAGRVPVTLDELMIETHRPDRRVTLTSPLGSVYSTETLRENRFVDQGWRIDGAEVLEDYSIWLDHRPLDRSKAVRVEVYPHQFKRFYPDGLVEKVSLLDSLHVLVVELDNCNAKEVIAYPLFRETERNQGYVTNFDRNIMLMGRQNHLQRIDEYDRPAVVAMTWQGENLWTAGFYDTTTINGSFAPSNIRTVNPVTRHTLIFAAGDSAQPTLTAIKFAGKNHERMLAKREARFEKFLNDSYFRTNDSTFDKALRWAMLSLEGLMMDGNHVELLSGVPAGTTSHEEDVAVAFRGAALVNGRFEKAAQLLRRAADDVDRHPSALSSMMFTRNVLEYLNATGDSSLLKEVYPLIKRGIEKNLSSHTDSSGFLLHGDGETWMHAAGPRGELTPRGNRAVEVQALWAQQLAAGVILATRLNDVASTTRWAAARTRLSSNFGKTFVDRRDTMMVDRLLPSGSADHAVRPNGLFALDFVEEGRMRDRIFQKLTESIVYPHGVGSLSQTDAAFRPYHHDEPNYPSNAGKFNGVISSWMSGEWTDRAVKYGFADVAYTVTSNQVRQILDQGPVGTLPECVDVVSKSGSDSPESSGKYSHAPALAEFIRTAYQSYFGVQIHPTSDGHPSVSIEPRLPKGFTSIDADIRIGAGQIHVEVDRVARTMTISSDSLKVGIPLTVSLPLDDGTTISGTTTLVSHGIRRFVFEESGVKELSADGTISTLLNSTKRQSRSLDTLILAVPRTSLEASAAARPAHRRLTAAELTVTSSSERIIYQANDPVGDDRGPGTFVYPRTWEPGSLDLTQFRVATDDLNMYFTIRLKSLSNRGLHPETGFQGTLLAIAIDKDGIQWLGKKSVGMNSGYAFDKSFCFERIIYVGTGIVVEGSDGKIIAEYLPSPGERTAIIGDIHSGTITFSIPLEVLGSPKRSWRFGLLSGVENSYDGTGIGDFRTVESVAGKFTGGGRKKASDSNIYDVLMSKGKR